MQPIERKHLRVRPLATLGDQKSEVYRLTFSPDGTLLISDGAKTCFWREQADGSWHLQRSSMGAFKRMNPDQSIALIFYKDYPPDHIEFQDSAGNCLQTISCSQIKQRYCYGYSLDNKWLLTYDDDG